MAKVLKITKPDATIHVVPLANKSRLESFNRRLKADKRWKLEVIDEADANGLPYKDPNFVSAGDAVKRLTEKDAEIADKESEIAELKALLAAANGPKVAEVVKEKELTEKDAENEPEEVDAPAPVIPPLTRAEKQKLARQKAKAAKA